MALPSLFYISACLIIREAISWSYKSKIFCLCGCKILDLCTFLLHDCISASSENFYCCCCSLAYFSFLPFISRQFILPAYIISQKGRCLSCQTAFIWNVKDRAVGQRFLIIRIDVTHLCTGKQDIQWNWLGLLGIMCFILQIITVYWNWNIEEALDPFWSNCLYENRNSIFPVWNYI